jgi:hypothetical protein
MAQTTVDRAITEESEQFRVLHWRLSQLVDAGFELEDATVLAFQLDIDLHQAIGLLERGCRAEIAARILI